MKKIAKWFERFDYKWVIIAISFLMVFTTLGFCSGPRSIFLKPICDAFGMSRSAYSLTDTCRNIATTVANIFFGVLIARFGMKKLMFAGFTCLVASSLVFSAADTLWAFYIGGLLLGLGFAWTTTTMVGAIVSKWCKHNKGTIMGIILASNGIGATVALQIFSPIVDSDPLGFRTAFRLMALIIFVVAVIVLLLFKDKPWHTFPDSPANRKPEKKVKKKLERGNWVGIPYSDAMKKVYFYSVAVCMFFTRMIQQNIPYVTHYQDLGFDAEWVALVASLASLFLTGTKIVIGFLYDRLGLRLAVTLNYICAIISQILIITVANTPMGKVTTLLYCAFHAFALPLDTVMVPIIAGDLFGEHSYAKILGILTAVGTAGTAIGSPLANASYDIFKSYMPIFYVGLAIFVCCTVAIQFTISAGNKERAKRVKLAEKTAEIAVK